MCLYIYSTYRPSSEDQTSTHHIIYTCICVYTGLRGSDQYSSHNLYMYVCNTGLRGSDQYSSHNLYMYVCNTGLRGSNQYSSHNLYMYVCNTGLRGSDQYSSHNVYMYMCIYRPQRLRPVLIT